MNKYIEAILSHEGSYVININGGDFVSGNGFEIFNLVFTSIKQLVSKKLLCFDNHETKSVAYTDENIPVYPMDFSTNFYIEVKNIVSAEELVAEDYQDVFEYPTKRIFNLHMDNKSIITIGLLD